MLITTARISLFGGLIRASICRVHSRLGMNLTRQQLTLLAVGVLLFLTGLGVKYWRMTHATAEVSRIEAR